MFSFSQPGSKPPAGIGRSKSQAAAARTCAVPGSRVPRRTWVSPFQAFRTSSYLRTEHEPGPQLGTYMIERQSEYIAQALSEPRHLRDGALEGRAGPVQPRGSRGARTAGVGGRARHFVA